MTPAGLLVRGAESSLRREWLTRQAKFV